MATFLKRRLEATPQRMVVEIPLKDEGLVVYAFRSKPNLTRELLDDNMVRLSYDGVLYENKYDKVEGKIEDFPGYQALVLNRGTPKEVVVLMESGGPPSTPLDTPPLVPAYCLHGLADHPDGRRLRIGRSWVLSRYMYTTLTTPPKVGCALCFGEVKPDDWPVGETAAEAAARAFAEANAGV